MRVFITGATGFIGGHVARLLRERGDEVVALVRSPDRATALRGAGCELVAGDLDDTAAIRRGVQGADSVIHAAAIYSVGIPARERARMMDTNVGGTERVLGAAVEAGVPRIVYLSTCNVFGNTGGRVVDETYRRDEAAGFLSCYDESKYRAHLVAERMAGEGAPIVIVQPGGVYGPSDHSELGSVIEQARTGKLPGIAFPDMGIMVTHVEDIARGILLALDRGHLGEKYILSSDRSTMRDIVVAAAEVGGRRPPRMTVPALVLKAMIPLGPLVGRMMKLPPNLGELIRASDGVTYWADARKAREELGWTARDLRTGLRDTFAAEDATSTAAA